MPILLLKLLGIGKWLKEALWRAVGLIGPFRGRASMFSCSQLG